MSGGVQRVEKVFSTRCEWKAGKSAFHSQHQFAVKWHFKHQKMLETHILQQIDKGSNILLHAHGLSARPSLKTSPRAGFPGASGPGDVHAAACGLQSKDCGPSMHPVDFVDSLHRFASGFLLINHPFIFIIT